MLFEACISWLQHSPIDRKASFSSVIQCVRFANISSFYFCDNVDNNPALRECEGLQELLNSVRAYHMMRHRHLEVYSALISTIYRH
jgi:hypothetical protein